MGVVALACAQVVQMSGEGKLSIGDSPRETRVRLYVEVEVRSEVKPMCAESSDE